MTNTDDATVEIENANWNLGEGKEIRTAILDGASQTAVPALVSTPSICGAPIAPYLQAITAQTIALSKRA